MATEAEIAHSVAKYVHKVPYLWGGANPHGADCSGIVNYGFCHDLGLNIPGYRGGTFTGRVHGPNTTVWLAWHGIKEIARAKCNTGTVVIWPTHMGVAVSPTRYVSAYDSQLGVVVLPIHGGGPVGEVARFFILRNIGSHPHGGGGGGGNVGGPIPGGNPVTGSAWNSMQGEWTNLRRALGPFQQRNINKVVGYIHRADRVSRS